MSNELRPPDPILLVDDEESWITCLSLNLAAAGGINNLVSCTDSRLVDGIMSREQISLVLLDLTMPHISGRKILESLTLNYPEIPVIILSGQNELETAVECMTMGAFDYFVKTVEIERLLTGIHRALSHQLMRQEISSLKDSLLNKELKHPDAFSEIITRNTKMLAIFQYVEAIAMSREPVLISGESGVGKELLAQAIHRTSLPSAPWVAVNVAGLDDAMFSDTLFGHAKGAFTGADKERAGMIEKAAGGTLFLDEIGDLHPGSQIKLLRLLQEGEFFPLGSDHPKRLSARIIVATNQDLQAKQERGEFRKDLYYRLFTHQLLIPPLRERREDIPLLLTHFLQAAAGALGKKTPTPPRELAGLLETYHFPGNVRELHGLVYNAVSIHSSGKLSMDVFKKAIVESRKHSFAETTSNAIPPDPASLNSLERLPTLKEAADLLVTEAMRRSGGNQSIAATLLGISQPSLNRRLKKMSEKFPDSR